MPAFFTETDLQCFGLSVFDSIVNDLLYHPEHMDLFFFGDLYLLDDVELDIDGVFGIDLVDEFADRLEQPPPFKGVWQQIVGDAAHAADDLIQVTAGLGQDQPVRFIQDIHAADIELYRGQKRPQAVVQIYGDAFALVLADGDLGKDLLP